MIKDLIKKNRSVRGYDISREVTNEELREMVDCARLSASSVNMQPLIIVDAVGVTKSKKSDTRPLERKLTVSLKELMMNVAMGAKDEDTLTTLASRIV